MLNDKGLISKKASLHARHTIFVHFFAVGLHDYNVRLPETSQLHVLWRKGRTCSCSLFFFFTAAFHPGGRQHFSFSYRRYKIFMLFFQQKMYPLFFNSCSSSPSLFFSLNFAGLSPTFSFSLSFSFSIFQIIRQDN